MFHDIVLALSGIGGEVLKNLLNEEIVGLCLSIHPCEKKILNELITIAESYKFIKGFIKKVPHFGSETIVLDDGSEIMPGMYLRSFCNGVDKSLEPYRKNVIKLEQKILQDPYFTLTEILAEVSEFLPLLTTISSMINQIVVRKLHGCRILQLLHQYLSSGIEMVDDAVLRIQHGCHLVMLRQLTSWLLYGQLTDTFGEFFIEPLVSSPRGDLHCSMTTLDSESLPENHLFEAGLQEYRIITEMVPTYIPSSIPEKAKFIGETVVLFSHGNTKDKSNMKTNFQDSVYKRMECTLLEQLKGLQNSLVLDVSLLESVVDSVRSCVTQHLFSLAKDKADLMGELQLMKDFFLLGRGELFVTFLRKASKLLSKPVYSNSGRDLSNILYGVMRNTFLNSEGVMEKFFFKVPPQDRVPPGSNVWSVMTLEYNPPWPLHLLFTPSIIAVYNSLFSFLLQVKQAELNFHDVWIDNIKKKDGQVPAEVWTLRNRFMFLVHNLQCYLMFEVLEKEFVSLVNDLAKIQDFEAVIRRHQIFILNVSVQAFIQSKEVHNLDQPTTVKRHPVNKCLTEILKLCDTFCAEAAKAELNLENYKEIAEELDVNISVLMNLITLMKGSGLNLLLLRLDYNRYFSSRN